MTKSRRGAALLLIGAFVLGALAGGAALAVASRPATPRRTAERPSPVARLAQDLRLSQAQQDSVTAILRRYHPEFQAVRDRIAQDIRGVLTPEQQFSYDSILAAKRAADSLRRLDATRERTH
jgi:hypothetical protein